MQPGGTDISLPCLLPPLRFSLHMFCPSLGHPLWSVPLPSASPAEAQRLPYYATYCPTRLLIHSMCTSHYLDIFITFIICLNVVTMSLEHYNQPMVSPSPASTHGPMVGGRVVARPQQDPPQGQGGSCWVWHPGSSWR